MLVKGPHPEEDRDVYHWFEMCDAVQNESDAIDGIKVSNFVRRLYFTRDWEPKSARSTERLAMKKALLVGRGQRRRGTGAAAV